MAWMAGWSYRKPITIDYTKVDSDLTDFPVLAALASDNFDFAKARTDGYDIRFTASDGTTLLKHERERHNKTDTVAEYHVMVPAVDSSTDTLFYMYYGKAAEADGADPTNVWDSDFEGVWHMSQDPSGSAPQILDSTSNGRHLTSQGTMTSGDLIDGKIGQAIAFDGSDDAVMTNTQFYNFQPMTVEGWIRGLTGTGEKGFIGSTPHHIGNLDTSAGRGADRIGAMCYDGGYKYLGKTGLDDATWYHAVLVYNAVNDGIELYINGVSEDTDVFGTFSNASYRRFSIGGVAGHLDNLVNFKALVDIDEVRVSSALRTAAWVKATYNSGNDSLVSYGSEELEPFHYEKTVTANARIISTFDETVAGNARIRARITKTVPGIAAIKATIEETVVGDGRTVFRIQEDIAGNARILVPAVKTLTSNAAIMAWTIPAQSRLDSIQRYDTLLSYRFDRENVARAIGGVADSIGYEWWVNEDDVLCCFLQKGADKSATITISDEIVSVNQAFDASKLINKLIVVGMGPGSSQLEVTVNDAESQAQYGVIEGTFSSKEIHDIDTLTSFANSALESTKLAKHRMTITLVGTERTDIELGDTIHVEHQDAGIDGDFRIIFMERVSGVAGELTKLEIAVPQFRVTETILDVERRVDSNDYHPQGAPAILTLARADNVDATHSLSMKFYVPPEAVDMGRLQIKEAEVALTLEAFRAYSTGAASGGGHTSGSGGAQTSSGGSSHSHGVTGQTTDADGSHVHKMFEYIDTAPSGASVRRLWAYEDEAQTTSVVTELAIASGKSLYTYGAGGTHSHTVTGWTSQTEASHTHTVANHTHTVANHTHGIAYGIYESTSPADVYIKLNGDIIAGPFDVDDYVDITTEFLAEITTYGWNTLEFTTTQLGKIGATLYMRMFLQAS